MKGRPARIATIYMDDALQALKEDPLSEGMYRPNYGGRGLANLPSSIFDMLSCRADGWPALDGDVVPRGAHHSTVILFLVDAFGYSLFQDSLKKSPYLEKFASLFPPAAVTTVFPSTTATALTTLNTGVPPSRHGIVGYTMYLKEFGLIGNMLDFKAVTSPKDDSLFDKGLSPGGFLGVPTVHQRLREQGVESYVVTKNIIINSGLSRMVHTGAGIIGYASLGDMFVQLRRLLERRAGRPKYVFVYWSAVDTVCHMYGPKTEEAASEVRSFFYSFHEEFLTRLSPRVRKDCAALLTADHGQVRVDRVYDTHRDKELMDMLVIPPAGDSRVSFLHAKGGASERMKLHIKKSRPSYLSMDVGEALRSGLLGGTSPKAGLLDRLGEVVTIAGPNEATFYPFKDKVFPNKGAHSGLSEDELVVPLFYAPFGELR
ncbi:MAG: alkaline phosphatase family protein [Nitrososphaerota archaeon]|nr:alkaline phosphatase family protein [Nitrososphaerota archaeon]